MATAKLSFEPQFHRYVEHGKVSGWIVAIPPFGSVISFAAEIGDEQRRIEVEGGAIVVVDLRLNRQNFRDADCARERSTELLP